MVGDEYVNKASTLWTVVMFVVDINRWRLLDRHGNHNEMFALCKNHSTLLPSLHLPH